MSLIVFADDRCLIITNAFHSLECNVVKQRMINQRTENNETTHNNHSYLFHISREISNRRRVLNHDVFSFSLLFTIEAFGRL